MMTRPPGSQRLLLLSCCYHINFIRLIRFIITRPPGNIKQSRPLSYIIIPEVDGLYSQLLNLREAARPRNPTWRQTVREVP